MQREALMVGLSGFTLLAASAAYAFVQKAHAEAPRQAAESDRVVTLDQVPAAVRATILRHAASGTITQIESENENGTLIYSIESSAGEFEVGADGAFLGMEDDDGEQDGD